MRQYFGLDENNSRTCVAYVALVTGKVLEVVPRSRLTNLRIQADSGERSEVELHTAIFGDRTTLETTVDLLGARIVCAVHNVQDFDSAPTHHDRYRDHQVLCILDGPKAGTMLEFKEERCP